MLFVELINNIIMGKSTKEKLIIEAFKLFASKPYDQVTFADLEKVTNLSRGAILYHVKTKENLFNEVIHYFIFQTVSAASVENRDKMTLREFLMACIDECDRGIKKMAEIGIYNINLAKLNIESQGFYFYPQMKEEAEKWLEEQYAIFEKVIEKAIVECEIKPVADISCIASLFIDSYLGISYSGIIRDNGMDINKLKNNLLLIYSMLSSK
ncbi:TetR/AcrR family transcriptional regulator [Bacteroides fragilis]|uniref:TetR/AcrR family transcriptional regulator n=1 Tax=Bacteroides fragilis TaxID=817 RepID=UPI00202ECDEC|nr:TetR/AcrR family transcriptional regulator [Bacteroides fragilis]MCM0347404.1 TetR/AcrR family transcriptional regulator [Bacteroides fragilis]